VPGGPRGRRHGEFPDLGRPSVPLSGPRPGDIPAASRDPKSHRLTSPVREGVRMTPRRVSWTGKPINRRQAARVGLTAGALLAVVIAGCDPRQAMSFLQPFEPQIKPPCPSLNGKKVVVLARASATVQSEYVPLDQELAQRLAKALREKVRKVEVVELSKVR